MEIAPYCPSWTLRYYDRFSVARCLPSFSHAESVVIPWVRQARMVGKEGPGDLDYDRFSVAWSGMRFWKPPRTGVARRQGWFRAESVVTEA